MTDGEWGICSCTDRRVETLTQGEPAIQKTIKKQVTFEGIGLHLGEKARVTLHPAEPDTGVLFCRKDLPEEPLIPATVDFLVEASRRTVIGTSGVRIETVEHLLAALSGLGIDNVLVEVIGEEIPILDGSAKPIVDLILEGGIREYHRPRRVYRLKEPVYIRDGESFLMATPAGHLNISVTIQHSRVREIVQFLQRDMNESVFCNDLAPARTYGFHDEIESLKERGLIRGGSLENAVVITGDGVLNEDGLRFEDEFVRHKMLDVYGDLALLGADLCASIVAIRPGHDVNSRLVKKILQTARIESSSGIYLDRLVDEVMDINEIRKIIPHRYPFLLIDKILSIEPDRKVVGLKNVTANEQFFEGHFPDYPIMPGVLIIEAMGQVGGILLLSRKENLGKTAFFMGLDKVKFRRPVLPGDQLVFEVEKIKIRKHTGIMKGQAFANGRLAAEAELKFAIVDE